MTDINRQISSLPRAVDEQRVRRLVSAAWNGLWVEITKSNPPKGEIMLALCILQRRALMKAQEETGNPTAAALLFAEAVAMMTPDEITYTDETGGCFREKTP